jgi:hypothetical protein
MTLLEHIRFGTRQSLKISIQSISEIDQALPKLGLELERPVLVIIGGAAGILEQDWNPILESIFNIAQIAHEEKAIVLDGGTDSGIMSAMGKIRAENNYTFPLIGIAAEGTVKWPGRKLSFRDRLPFFQNAGDLDPNHTHFIIVPGNNWGDESVWITEIATRLAGDNPSLAILINGGMISREQDVPNNLKAGRTVLVITGTGRAADEFAAHPLETNLMQFVHVEDSKKLSEILMSHFQPST